MPNEGRIIDLTALEGAQSLALEKYENLVLGEQVKEVIDKIKEAIESGQNIKNNSDVYLPNNVFIDGRRGSGKTTILLTAKEVLEKTKSLNVSGKEQKIRVLESLIDTSVNTSSITFYFLSWLKKEIEDKYYSNAKLTDQLYKTIKLFPGYLKTCDELCQDLDKNEEIEEALDKSDLNFRRELFKLIDLFLEEEKKDAIIMFVDDIDISFPPKRIEKILTEIFMFLSHPKLLIVSAGNYQNLIETLECFVKENLKDCPSYTNDYKGIKVRNISKSFLEKTFSRYKVKIPELSYETISNFKIKTSRKTTNPISIKDYLEQIPIIGVLGWNSPIFKTLFNGLSIRELVLILKEALEKIIDKNRKSTDTDSNHVAVASFCFSDTYQKIKNLDNIYLLFDTRLQALVHEANKPNEFSSIHKEISKNIKKLIQILQKSPLELEQTADPVFTDFYRQSLLVHNLYLNNDHKATSLFWLWLNENFLFMEGFKKSLPRLIFTEIIKAILVDNEIDFKENQGIYNLLFIKSSLETWSSLNYDFKALTNYFLQYDFYTGSLLQEPGTFKLDHFSKYSKLSSILENNLSRAKRYYEKIHGLTLPDSRKEVIETKLHERFVKEKAYNKIILLSELLNRLEDLTANLSYNKELLSSQTTNLNSFAIDKLMSGFIDKIATKLRTITVEVEFDIPDKQNLKYFKQLLLFLTLYANLARKIAYFYTGNIKEAFSQEIVFSKDIEDLLRLKENPQILQFINDIESLLLSLRNKRQFLNDRNLKSLRKLYNLIIRYTMSPDFRTEHRLTLRRTVRRIRELVEKARNHPDKIKEINSQIKKYILELITIVNSIKHNLNFPQEDSHDEAQKDFLLSFYKKVITSSPKGLDTIIEQISKNNSSNSTEILNFLKTVKEDIELVLEYLGIETSLREFLERNTAHSDENKNTSD